MPPVLAVRAVLAARPFVATLLLTFAWLLLMRGLLILYTRVWPEPGWMLLADGAAAVVLALLLSITRTAWLRVPMVLILGTAYYIAAQHMWAQGTIFRLAHLGRTTDPVFLTSSVLTPSLLLLPLCCLLAYMLHRLHLRIEPRPPRRRVRRLAVAAGMVAVYGIAVTSLTAPDNNVVVSTLAQIPDAAMSLRGPPGPEQVKPIESGLENRFFHREVRGGPGGERPNVLVVVIEGMSGAYLPSVARYHDLSPAVALHGLERDLDRRGFRVYRNVLSMQRQTDRGSYPLLCGAYPRVGTMNPKLADVAADEVDPDCAPDVLGRQGYQTGYLQAAPLEFMNKDAFLPKIGFERVHGADYFGPAEDTEGWGPPDEEFFPAAANWLRDLDADGSPWFAVTLNAGTHHPFPDGAAERTRSESGAAAAEDPQPSETTVQPDRQAAFVLMARHLIEFFDELTSLDLLDETLVVVTSDEAGGFVRGDGQARVLDGNFGTLAVRPPAHMTLDDLAGRDALVATLDIALTAIDAAGLADHDPGSRDMIGRSLLVRQPAATRGLLLGDTYAGHTAFLLESGELLACGEGLIRCGSWTFSPQRPFGTLEQVSEPAFIDMPTRTRLVERAAVVELPPAPLD